MHRESEKHGPAREERTGAETEGLTGTGGTAHPVTDRSGGQDGRPEHAKATPCMSPADVARRAELNRHLPPNEFPADRERLLTRLRARKAPGSVIETISRLPEGQEFHSVGEIVRAAGRYAHH